MPSSTAWLPLERVREAKVVLCDLRWLEAVRVVFAQARKSSVPTVLDADLGARDALADILPLTDYAVFSKPALDDFAGEQEAPRQLARVLSFGCRHAGVTLGEGGYTWQSAGGAPAHQESFTVDVVDTTGAGDAFHGAFALAIAEGRPVEECARRAAAVAALKCRRLGSRAGLPVKRELEAFLRVE
jgi:sulfofructose kinase